MKRYLDLYDLEPVDLVRVGEAGTVADVVGSGCTRLAIQGAEESAQGLTDV